MASQYRITVVLLLVAALFLPGCAQNGPSVYAVVDGKEITREAYQSYENFLRLSQPGLELSRDEQKQVLADMVDRQVYLAEAEKRGFAVDPEAAQKEYDNFRTQVLSQDLFGNSRVVFLTRLQELGLSEKWILALIGEYQVINAMIEAEREKAPEPDDLAIETYYKEKKDSVYAHGELRNVRHILVNKDNFPEDEEDVAQKTKELADNLYNRLTTGEDFAQLAQEYSQDSSAKEGGKIGFIEKGDVVESFGEEAFSLELNVVSQPVESRYGWHILEVLEIQPAGHYELDETIKAQISSTLLKNEGNRLVEALLLELTEKAQITTNFK